MPSRNIIKTYVPNGFYHIYNRGVEKRDIFQSKVDYIFFLKTLKKSIDKSNVSVLCYCLMPNHFHLLIKQSDRRDITKLMRVLGSKYTTYFNYKYERVGRLFQGTYKARLIKTDEDLLNISSYIHNNPGRIGLNPKTYEYSSLKLYIGKAASDWTNTRTIKSYCNIEQYNDFVVRTRDFEVALG
ncbi:MAG: hypothetical protein UX79_C0009G0008 [candidate division WWE3 bacterium GW2011_GWB1_47_11]|uniref:Transposase IS200-like domain-containing protein n=2 Tax=Katanobacteria TaxID=422282 RepID=A0A0G1TTN7_UNCKA|nr:MAG: hypothetical protein UX73_C0025G0006 [candidate division WWE3 bacterium GW2011_GWC1_47_10]KKU57543.1 MAG: hypothetical protein UX79_C0009G0008 [candidate division WWE3 bacterium GW2011_GWB1_47_11]